MLLVATTALTLAGLVLLFLKPNEYTASTRVVTSESPNASLLGSVGRSLSSAARLLGDNQGGSYAQQFAILTSDGFLRPAVDSFRLVSVYDVADTKYPQDEALRLLRKRALFELDPEFEYLSISVTDENPRRAADMANFFTRRLNSESARLRNETATQYRAFIEARYRKAEQDVDSLLTQTKEFQRRYGVFDLPSQSQAFFTQVASLRAEMVRLEVQLETAKAEFGPESTQVRALQEAVSKATEQYNRALEGRERALPVSQAALPEMARQYANLKQQEEMQRSILEVVAPLFETAKLEESRRTAPLQVIDWARAPVFKSSPKRAFLSVMIAISSFILLTLWMVLLYVWRTQVPVWRRWLEPATAPHQP